MDSRRKPHPPAQPFTDKEIELIMDFAAQAAISLEITRRERRFREVQRQLAHANRVATMGPLTASIAHELKQPLAGVISSGGAALNWLKRCPTQGQGGKPICHAHDQSSYSGKRYCRPDPRPREEGFATNGCIAYQRRHQRGN
jgi:signal transduction histidine kinase